MGSTMTEASVPGFAQKDLNRLHALRRAAAEILDSTVIQAGGDVGVSISMRVGENMLISRRGHDSERFRSFMIARSPAPVHRREQAVRRPDAG
jgi:hypothetical protein